MPARFLAILISTFITLQAIAQGDSDTIRAEAYRFRPVQLIAPGVLVAVGAVGIHSFKGLKRDINKELRASSPVNADKYLQFVPALAYEGLGFIHGMPGRHTDFTGRILAGATAYVAATAITVAIKPLAREMRPDGTERNSFPSGHTARAFTGAELMRIEYGPLVGACGYAVATATGVLRVVNNRHWYNDVLAGAGIGILSARIGYWLLPLEQRLLHLPSGTVILPSASTTGVAFTASIPL